MPTVTTLAALEKIAKNHGGDGTVAAITQVGWGSGGHDPLTGDPVVPDGTETQVPGEFLKKAIDAHSYPDQTSLLIEVSLQATEGNGNEVSACGLYDSDGTLIALKTFAPKTKEDDMVIEIDWTETLS